MNWKCKLGIHDWYIVDHVNGMGELFQRIRRDKEVVKPGGPPAAVESSRNYSHGFTTHGFTNRVCLRCGKKIDQITPAKILAEKEMLQRRKNKEKAKKLWDNKNEL